MCCDMERIWRLKSNDAQHRAEAHFTLILLGKAGIIPSRALYKNSHQLSPKYQAEIE